MTERQPITVTYAGTQTRRRIRYEPRASGGWRRICQREGAAGEWVTTGQEIVHDVALQTRHPARWG